jgi:hypothetical protein
MKHFFLLSIKALMLALLLSSCNDVMVVLENLPEGTPPNEPLYLTGTFNNGQEDDERYRFFNLNDGRLGVKLPMMAGVVECKVTRGSWLTVEADSCGKDIPNRKIKVNLDGEVGFNVVSWKDRSAAICDYVDVVVHVRNPLRWNDDLYLCGSHNDWKLFDPIYRLKPLNDSLYHGRLPRREETIEYKINRGDWDQVEVAADGTALPNRILTKDTPDSLYLIVEEWRDEVIKQSPNLTIVIDKLPTIPKGSSIFLASNINNWNPANAIHRFVIPPGEDNYMLTVPRQGDEIFFKLTLGSWSTVETQSNGLIDIDNREWVYGLDDTIHIRVAGWKAD